MAETVLFYAFSGLAIAASVFVIGQRNPMYSVLLLVASFAAISGLYIQLDAPFIAVTQMIVYAGALMVLFLFVVMLLNEPREDAANWDQAHPLKTAGAARFGAALAVLLVVQIGYALLRTGAVRGVIGGAGDTVSPESVASVRTIGRVLFRDYVFAFEATSLLILVALLGGVYLAQREADR